jgi:hypothetical protein
VLRFLGYNFTLKYFQTFSRDSWQINELLGVIVKEKYTRTLHSSLFPFLILWIYYKHILNPCHLSFWAYDKWLSIKPSCDLTTAVVFMYNGFLKYLRLGIKCPWKHFFSYRSAREKLTFHFCIHYLWMEYSVWHEVWKSMEGLRKWQQNWAYLQEGFLLQSVHDKWRDGWKEREIHWNLYLKPIFSSLCFSTI